MSEVMCTWGGRLLCDVCNRAAEEVPAGAVILDNSGSGTALCQLCFQFVGMMDRLLKDPDFDESDVSVEGIESIEANYNDMPEGKKQSTYSFNKLIAAIYRIGVPRHTSLWLLLSSFKNDIGVPLNVVLQEFSPDVTLAEALVREQQCIFKRTGKRRVKVVLSQASSNVQQLLDTYFSPTDASNLQMRLVCVSCQKQKKLRFCSRCKLVAYCGTECQNDDWKTHKPYCFDIKQLPE